MRIIFLLTMIAFCLSGCSEMKVIGNVAMRELRADAVGVNWNKSVPVTKTATAQAQALLQTKYAKVKTFSAFGSNRNSTKTQVKGLWEQHGG